MNSPARSNRSKRIRTLLQAGATLLVTGMVLHWAATSLARVYLSRDANGSISTIDENRKDNIQHVGDKLSWLGLGLVLVGAGIWANRDESQQAGGESQSD